MDRKSGLCCSPRAANLGENVVKSRELAGFGGEIRSASVFGFEFSQFQAERRGQRREMTQRALRLERRDDRGTDGLGNFRPQRSVAIEGRRNAIEGAGGRRTGGQMTGRQVVTRQRENHTASLFDPGRG